MTMGERTLVIDDESDVCEFVSAVAESMGIHCTTTTDSEVFLAALAPDINLIFST